LKPTEREATPPDERPYGLDQVKTRFFANLSHELRTPLTLILGPTQKLLASGSLSRAHRQELEVVERNARVLLKHVNDLLNVAKLDAGELTPNYSQVDLAQLVRQVASQFDSLAGERRLEYSVETPQSLASEIDPDMMGRLVTNLLANAFKFTPAGGRIHCSVRKGDGGERGIITVSDSGPGVPEELREAIFERFFQAEESTTRQLGGTGLGLAIARDFAELHGGSITAGETKGGGATFTVELALAPADNAAHASQTAELPPLPGSGARDLKRVHKDPTPANETPSGSTGAPPLVLIVEDNEEMSRYIGEALSQDYRVESAADGRAGHEKAMATRPDLVISEVLLPVMSGSQLVREIRAQQSLSATPIVVLAAKEDEELQMRLLRTGAQDYLTKPFSAEQLKVRVTNLVEVRRAREQLEAASKEMEAFTYSVSHDLRAPLRAIDGFSRILQDEHSGQLDETGQDFLARVREGSQQMEALIDALLSLSQVTRVPLRRERVDLTATAQALAEELQRREPKRRVTFRIAQGLSVLGDSRLLGRVLRNLFENAWKFTSRKDIAEIEFGAEPEAGTGARVFWVRDNGAGFDMAYGGKLFGAFQRLHSRTEFDGTGAGLAVVKRIIHRHGGRVWAEGEVDRGATLFFAL